MLKKQFSSTFLGCNKSFLNSNIIIFGAPFDSTTSNRPGTRFASNDIRKESYGLETYSPYLNLDITDYNICDIGDLELCLGDTLKTIKIIKRNVKKIVTKNKIPIMIGGEHILTFGSFLAVLEKYSDINVIHLDAHADARESYLNNKYSHASIIKRIWEKIGDNRIYQYGIRSYEKNEFFWCEKHVNFIKNIDNIDNIILNKPVYLTIDLDILDPAYLPGTGTPEPGGIQFLELLKIIYTLSSKLNIVGCDLMELSPIYDISGMSSIVSAKILRELILSLNLKKKENFFNE